MSMQLFTLGLSYLVPLLFAASGILIVGRLTFDRLRLRNAAAARGAFALIFLAGAAAAAPYVRRAATLVSAEHAFGRADWLTAADRYASYARLRGSSVGRAGARRALALMNLRRYADAEAAFLASFPRVERGTFRARPNEVLSLGLCRYYTGRLDAAERTVRAVSPGVSPIRDYVLGRILDRRGDANAAVAAFQTSLAAAPCFYPALYQLVRVLRREGRETEAHAALESFCPPGTRQNRAQLASLAPRPEGQGIPPEKEFYFVQED
jgi:tetratricopeptide (TPR) repeat protein